MTRAERRGRGFAGRGARCATTALAAVLWLGACARPEAPPPLVELRQVVGAPAAEQGRAAAPDLVMESRRSLRLAEDALRRRDVARARWLATLGVLQARIAVAVARQQTAASRREAASIELQRVEEDLARFRAQQVDAQNEIRRLESLAGAAPSNDVGATPDQPRGE
jgi:hypothetical protein